MIKVFAIAIAANGNMPDDLLKTALVKFRFPMRVEIRTNVFVSGRPVVAFSDAEFWNAEYFTFQKKKL